MDSPNGTIAENRRARFDYDTIEKFEAGVVLDGHEVKSAKVGKLNLAGSYVLIRSGEAYLFNASIQAFPGANTPDDYDPDRTRKLLLHKKEIRTLTSKLEEKRLTVIPLRAFVTRNMIKVEIALARSKRAEDKREAIKKRDVEREIRRSL